MAKLIANKWVRVDAALIADIADPSAPTLTESGDFVSLSPAIAWDGFELALNESGDVDDLSLWDGAGATTRGNAEYAGSLSFFRSLDPTDPDSEYNDAFTLFKEPGLEVYLILRVGQVEGPTQWAAGDHISVFKFIADTFEDDTEGEDSLKFTVAFLPQGVVRPNTFIAPAGQIDVIFPVSGNYNSLSVGDIVAIDSEIAGHNSRALVTYVSSDPEVATVSPHGVVTALDDGTTTITLSHPAASSETVSVTVS